MKKSFNGLMTALYESENDMLELTPEQIAEILGDLKDKVDGMHDWLGRLDAEKDRLTKDIATLQARKKAVENAKVRFKEYIAFTMANNDTPKLFGNTWSVSCKPQTFVTVKKDIDITTSEYLELDGLIDRTYKLNSTEVKKAYKADPERFSKYVNVEDKNVVRFTAKRV